MERPANAATIALLPRELVLQTQWHCPNKGVRPRDPGLHVASGQTAADVPARRTAPVLAIRRTFSDGA